MSKEEMNFLIATGLLIHFCQILFIYEAWIIHSLMCKKDHNHGN